MQRAMSWAFWVADTVGLNEQNADALLLMDRDHHIALLLAPNVGRHLSHKPGLPHKAQILFPDRRRPQIGPSVEVGVGARWGADHDSR